jgi:hypothetical protein
MEDRVSSAGLSWKPVRRPEKHGRQSSVGWTLMEAKVQTTGVGKKPEFRRQQKPEFRQPESDRSQSSCNRSRIETGVQTTGVE